MTELASNEKIYSVQLIIPVPVSARNEAHAIRKAKWTLFKELDRDAEFRVESASVYVSSLEKEKYYYTGDMLHFNDKDITMENRTGCEEEYCDYCENHKSIGFGFHMRPCPVCT